MERLRRAPRQGTGAAVLWMILLALGAGLIFAAPASAGAPSSETTSHELESGGTTYPYLVHTPPGLGSAGPVPLVIATHGCQTTADQFLNATQYNQVADREGFIVAYPDVDPASVAAPGPLRNCWRFYSPETWERDQGHAAAVAGITRAIIGSLDVDEERVYMVGTSAGGFMTSAMAAAYPDLFAAVVIVAGGAYNDGFCLGPSPGLPVEQIAAQARDQMGSRARVVPRMTMGGDADQGIPPLCADKSFFQGLRTNNLVLGDSQTEPISLEAASSRTVATEGGYDSTVSTYLDPAGCVVGEHWSIHGMNHFWPGGSADPAWDNWTDPKGPSGAEASWAFFERFTKSSTAMPCAEVQTETPKPACPKRQVMLGLPKKVRSLKVTVNGRKVRSRIVKGKARVWLPANDRKRTVVVIKAKRKKSGKTVTRRQAFKGCGPRR